MVPDMNKEEKYQGTQLNGSQSRETGYQEYSDIEAHEFATMKITPLFWKYSLLGLAGLIAQAVSVIADGFFVGNSQGTMGLATIGIVTSLWTVTLALGALFAIGGSTVIANKLGEGDPEGAREAYASVTIFTFLFSLVLAILCLVNMDRLLLFLGSTPDILPHARAYATPYFIGIPFSITGTAVYYYTRAIGKPIASAIAYIAPAIVATILEYILLMRLDFGMEASAYSWVLCVASAFLLIPFMQVAKGGLKIHLKDFRLNFSLIGNALKVGFAPFLIELSVILTTIIINRQIVNYGHGEIEIAAFGMVNAYIVYIIMLLCNSLISGLLPITSYNFGMKSYTRVKQLLKTATVQSVVALSCLLAIIFVFAKPIVTFFVGDDPEVIEATIAIMHVFLPLYTLGCLALLTSGYYQAIENIRPALVSALCRVAFSTPLLFILPAILGYKGIWFAQPAADALAFILCVVLIRRECRKLDKLQESCN